MNHISAFIEARRACSAAYTAGMAVVHARICVVALTACAEEQEAGATKWISYGDDFCLDMGRMCNATAANARRHAAAYDRWANEVSRRFKPGDPGEKARKEIEWKLED